ALLNWRIRFLLGWGLRPSLQTESRVARVGPTTPTRARRPFDASVDHTDAHKATVRRFGRSDRSAQRYGPCHSLIVSIDGPRGHSPNRRPPPCDRGTGRRHRCRTARGPPKRLMRPEGTVVFARRTVLRSSFPRVRLAAILPVSVASMPHGEWAAIPLRGSRL